MGQSTPVVVALVRETQTIPIVFLNVADPIGSGFVVSLARPGGNLTGFATDNSALGGKWVQLLKEIAPRTVRAALMFNPTTAVPLKFYMPSVQAAASTSGVEVNAAPVHAKDEIEGVIAAQAPTKFDLIINLKTAKSLGLDVPFGMQQRADALIE